MKAYKITNNGKCKNQLYEVGETYQIEGKLIMCENGFHFCKNPNNLFSYYKYRKNITKIFEIEVLGECIDRDDKSVTDKLKVVRKIPLSEYNNLFKNHQFDEKYNLIHSKYSNGYELWEQFDDNGLIYHRDSKGIEYWYEYDDNGNLIHYKDFDGLECWYGHDDNGNVIYFKDSNGFEKYW